MTAFDENDHPRGHAGNAGQFRDKPNSGPETSLVAQPFSDALLDEVAERLPGDPWSADPEKLACIALSVLAEPGVPYIAVALAADGPREALERAFEIGRIRSGGGHARAVVAAISKARLHGIGLITRTDGGWPSQFADLGDRAPYALWTKGDAALLGEPDTMTSVAGSRAATGYGEHVTMEMAGSLSEAGQTVVTGAAYGIDGMAVRAVLNIHGKTIAVLPGGLDSYYPSGHQALLERVAEDGLVVSEIAPGHPTDKWRSQASARIVAALSSRTVIVEAGMRSGSLKAAAEALALGRDVCAVPGPVTSAASAGTHFLIASGGARLVTDVGEVLDGPPPRP